MTRTRGAILVLSVLLPACGGGGNTDSSLTAPMAVATVTVTPSPATVSVGQPVQLTAITKDVNGNVLTGRVISWSTSNAAVANVTATGLVTGVEVGGPVTITATSEGTNGLAAVTVTAAVPATVTLLSVAPSSGSTIRVTDFANIPILLQLNIASPVSASGKVFSGFQSGRPPSCYIVLAAAPSVTLFANQSQGVTLGPYQFTNVNGARAALADCPLPFTVTSVGYEWNDPTLFNVGAALTYTFVP